MSLDQHSLTIEKINKLAQNDLTNLLFKNSFSVPFLNLISPHFSNDIDTGHILKEQESYLTFKDRFRRFKSAKNRSQVYRCYYMPMLNKFTEKALQENTVPFQDFVDWYQRFKKAYTSSKNILEILNYFESSLVAPFEKYLNENKNVGKILYKRCAELGYTDSIKNMNITLSKLSIDPKNMTLKEGVTFCVNLQDNYLLISNKIIILQVKGFRHVDLLKTEQLTRNNRVEFLRKIAKDTKLRIKYIKEIDASIDGGLEFIPEMSVQELVSVVKKFQYKLKIMKVVEIILSDENKYKKVESQLSFQYSAGVCSRPSTIPSVNCIRLAKQFQIF